jgi:hypothetical protein
VSYSVPLQIHRFISTHTNSICKSLCIIICLLANQKLFNAGCRQLTDQLTALDLDWPNSYCLMQLLLSYCVKKDDVKRAYNKSKQRDKVHPGMALRLMHSQEKKLFTTYYKQLRLQHPGDITMAEFSYHVAKHDPKNVFIYDRTTAIVKDQVVTPGHKRARAPLPSTSVNQVIKYAALTNLILLPPHFLCRHSFILTIDQRYNDTLYSSCL